MARVRPQTSSLIPGLFRQRAADVQTPADVRFVIHVVDNIEIKKNAKVTVGLKIHTPPVFAKIKKFSLVVI